MKESVAKRTKTDSILIGNTVYVPVSRLRQISPVLAEVSILVDHVQAWAREAREELESRRTRAYDARARDDRASWDAWVRACEYMPREAIVAVEETEAYFERKAHSQAAAEKMDAAFEREDRDLAYNEALILQWTQ
jgi:hypothetical protein